MSTRGGKAKKVSQDNGDARWARRAADVAAVIDMENVLGCTDVILLQQKLIETAERLLALSQWGEDQLQERSTFYQHRLSSVTAYMARSDVWEAPDVILHGVKQPGSNRARDPASSLSSRSLNTGSPRSHGAWTSRHGSTRGVAVSCGVSTSGVARGSRGVGSAAGRSPGYSHYHDTHGRGGGTSNPPEADPSTEDRTPHTAHSRTSGGAPSRGNRRTIRSENSTPRGYPLASK